MAFGAIQHADLGDRCMSYAHVPVFISIAVSLISLCILILQPQERDILSIHVNESTDILT